MASPLNPCQAPRGFPAQPCRLDPPHTMGRRHVARPTYPVRPRTPRDLCIRPGIRASMPRDSCPCIGIRATASGSAPAASGFVPAASGIRAKYLGICATASGFVPAASGSVPAHRDPGCYNAFRAHLFRIRAATV